MPFALLIFGGLLLIAAVRGKQDTLFSLLKNDLTGPNNFVYWIVAILAIGVLGYVPNLKPVSTMFLVLVVLVLFLTKGDPNKSPGGGFFQQFTDQLQATQKKPTAEPAMVVGEGKLKPGSAVNEKYGVGLPALDDLLKSDLYGWVN